MEKDEGHHEHKSSNSDWMSKLFWGLVFILVGVLAILHNFGITTIYWSNIIKLWPVLIMVFGLSILTFHHAIWRVLIGICLILCLSVVGLAAVGYSPDKLLSHECRQDIVNCLNDGETGSIREELEKAGRQLENAFGK